MTKPKYRRLTYDDRGVIENMCKAKKTQSEIANAIGVSQSTISRELSRNRVEGVYTHGRAFMRTYLRLLLKPKRYLIGENEADILRQFWNYYRSNADCKFVGFNIYAWAIPFLVRRSWANRVIVPKILNGRYLNGNFIDLLQVWGCGTFEKASLGNIARFFGIKRKDEEINFNAMWQISPSRAIEKLKSDVLSIRRIGEAMGVVREEDSDEW